jgi:dihydroorotate dehydrogenase
MCLYKTLRPFLFLLDAETAHTLTLYALRAGLIISPPKIAHPALRNTLWGLKFDNPVGLAAGFDKNAQVMSSMLRLGFGHVEIGTVTPLPQAGNPKPRIFRSPAQHAVINRMGFPNQGLEYFRHNLEKFLEHADRPRGIVGINIGKNKDQDNAVADYVTLTKALSPLGVYICVIISSPNTPGLGSLQGREGLQSLIPEIRKAREDACAGGGRLPPILFKLAPDLDDAQINDLAALSLEYTIDGLVLTNTTLSRPPGLPSAFSAQTGGLSGAPIKDLANTTLSKFYKATGGKIPLIGVGGISSAEDAYARIRSGASLIQIYTGLAYQGPHVAYSINKRLLALLERDGLNHISQAVGAGHDD